MCSRRPWFESTALYGSVAEFPMNRDEQTENVIFERRGTSIDKRSMSNEVNPEPVPPPPEW